MKITREQQLAMFEDYHRNQESLRYLADKYGISHVTILKFMQTKAKQIDNIRDYIEVLDNVGKKKWKRKSKS